MLRFFIVSAICFFSLSAMAQIIRTDGAVLHVSNSSTVLTSGGISIQNNGAIQNAGTIYLGGDWINNGLGLTGALTGNVDFNGNQLQFIGGSSTTTFSLLRITNTSNVALSNNTNIGQTLVFNSGKINTGPYEVRMINPPANPIIGAGVGKYVNGNLRVAYALGNPPSFKYEIGSNAYAPATVSLSSVSNAGTMVASTTSGPSSLENFPTIGASGIDPSARVDRHWSLSQSALAYADYDVTFDYSNTPFTGSPSNYLIRRYRPQSGWQSEITSNNGATASGVLNEGVFVIGESSSTSINNLDSSPFRIHPNPANDRIFLNGLNSFGEKSSITILDLAGRKVFGLETEKSNTAIIDLQPLLLTSGVYTVRIEGNVSSGVFKTIIHK